MKLEVIVSTMNKKSIDFYKDINIKTDAIIINQNGKNEYEEKIIDDYKIRMFSTDTKGVGKSRNLGILNANADILLICDDDEILADDYEKKILDAFEKNPDIDFFVFKTRIYQGGKTIEKVKEEKYLSLYNCLRYGAVHYAFRRDRILKKNIFFTTYFGAGTEIGSGEDSIFITDAIKKGLKVKTNKSLIAEVYNDDSTWFKGYDEKFFYDKGKLWKALFPKTTRLFIEQFILRHPEFFVQIDKKKARKLLIKGAKDFEK